MSKALRNLDKNGESRFGGFPAEDREEQNPETGMESKVAAG